jgi:betaine-aldehyde dehydrogenase
VEVARTAADNVKRVHLERGYFYSPTVVAGLRQDDEMVQLEIFSARRLDFGCVWINTHIPLVAEMPHGGFKHSGYGKDLSMYGLEDYTRIKHVMS